MVHRDTESLVSERCYTELKPRYKEELKKSISVMSNIGLAFTILSIPASLLPFLSFALQTGGMHLIASL